MSLQKNKFLERNKLIATRIVKGELLKVVSSDNNISMERVRQITYDIIHKTGVEYSGYYRGFNIMQIKEVLLKIEALK